MSIKDFTKKHAVLLMSSLSKKKNVTSIELCKIHFELGKYLAYQIVEEFELAEVKFYHSLKVKKGFELKNKDDIVIIAILRSGLYVAEGIRSIFSNSEFLLFDSCFIEKFKDIDWKNKIVIIVDSVINTGKSIRKILDIIYANKTTKIFVCALILIKDTAIIEREYPDANFYILRILENTHSKAGHIDTGDRLYNKKIKK